MSIYSSTLADFFKESTISNNLIHNGPRIQEQLKAY